MSKFNVKVFPGRAACEAAQNTPAGPIVTATVSAGPTHQGGAGFGRDPRSELFLLAVTNMVAEGTFYEAAAVRDARFVELVARNAVTDPGWTASLLRWLRTSANLRTAAIVGAAEFVAARLATGDPDTHDGLNRNVIGAVLQRPDEPGELLAYWLGKHGRNIPKPIKRGVADAVRGLYTQKALLKYDTPRAPLRFGDVVQLVHPTPVSPEQGYLFRHAINRRHGRDDLGEATLLPMVYANWRLRVAAAQDPTVLLDPDRIARAGFTWENTSSTAGGTVDRAQMWAALIPSMGYMALLRNLRQFDEDRVPDEVAAQVAARLADPAQVAKSRQLPMRFLSAYRAVHNDRWALALETALNTSLGSIPPLSGRTLILVDTSGSMGAGFSKDGTLMRWDAAALFGLALAQRAATATVVSFSSGTMVFPLTPGESLLRGLERWRSGGFFMGQGTETAAAVRRHYSGHDRVVVLTDEQAGWDGGQVFGPVPATVPTYTWNLAGYRHGHAAGAPNRHTFGGLTDAMFGLINLLEAGAAGRWPWESAGSV